MKTVNDSIKNALKETTTQRKGRILVNDTYYEVYNVEYYADVYNEGSVVGNAIASQLDFDIPYISKFDIFKYFDGVWTGFGYEYIDMGTFTVFDEKDEDEFTKHITAFDNLIKFNSEFQDIGGYPKTLFEELQNICIQAGVELENTSIPNGSFIVENNQFVGGENLKTVLKNICGVSGTYATIKNDKLVLQLKNQTNEVMNKSEHEPIIWKRKTYGINQVILGMSDVDGEYVLRQDDEDIALNGVHKLVINDNLFAYTQDKREQLIDELFNQVKGFGYVPYELKTEWLSYLEIGDTINIDGNDTIVLRINGKSPKALESEMSAPAIIDSSVEYIDNTDSIKNQMKRTEIIVDKQNQTIEALVSTTEEITTDLDDNYYQKKDVEQLILNTESGLTNIFSTSGGNNLLKNTAPWNGEGTEWDFWEGKINRTTENDSATGYALLLQKGIVSQSVQLADGNYSISFKYKKLLSVANAKIRYNNREIILEDEGKIETTGLVNTKSFLFEIECDTDGGYEIYELMLNHGAGVYLPWMQSQNELKTTYVSISENIRIESDIENTAVALGVNGLLGQNKSTKEIVFKQTEDGSYSKNSEADKGTIGGISMQKVGNQSWITGV